MMETWDEVEAQYFSGSVATGDLYSFNKCKVCFSAVYMCAYEGYVAFTSLVV